jgi:S1-C subfamily serine protease
LWYFSPALLADRHFWWHRRPPNGWADYCRAHRQKQRSRPNRRTSAQRGLADVVSAVKPTVVSVTSHYTETAHSGRAAHGRPEFDPREHSNPAAGHFERLVTSKGTGFFISPDGYVVTNHHVVQSARSVEIATDDGSRYKAQVVASDPASDLALLKVDGRNDFPFVKFTDKAPRIGDQVFAVGNRSVSAAPSQPELFQGWGVTSAPILMTT